MKLVSAKGPGARRGSLIGEQMRESLPRAWQRWSENFATSGHDPEQLARQLADAPGWDACERFVPDLVDELQSTAKAAGMPWHQVAALSMLDEVWALTGGMACTAIAVTRDGQRAAGQNMDLELWTDTLQTVFQVRDHHGLGVVAATYPGSLATCGMNSNGVVVVVNALDLVTDPAGVMVDMVVRGALHQPSARDAIDFVRSVPHASGQTYTIVDAHELYMVEADATGVIDVPEVDPLVALHTNHSFTREHPVSVSSRTRYDAITATRDNIHSAKDIREALTNMDTGVCQRAGRFTPGMFTFMGIVGDCLARRVWVNVSPATGGGFTEVAFL